MPPKNPDRARLTADAQLKALHRPSDVTRNELPASAHIEAIAQRTAELLRGQPIAGYVDTGAVARLLSVSQDWIRSHAADLGAVRLGDGPKAPLRFDLERVIDWAEARRLDRPPRPVRRTRRRPAPPPRDVELLPLPKAAA